MQVKNSFFFLFFFLLLFKIYFLNYTFIARLCFFVSNSVQKWNQELPQILQGYIEYKYPEYMYVGFLQTIWGKKKQ